MALNYVYGDKNKHVPVHLNFGKYMLDRLRLMGDKIAVINATTGEELTYRNFVQYSVNLATSLSKFGIGKGDVIAIGSEERNLLVPTILSIIFTGATCNPYDINNGKAVLRHKIKLAKPTHFITSKLFWEKYGEVVASCDSIKSYFTLDDIPHNAITIESFISKEVDTESYEPAKVLGQLDTAYIIHSSGTTGLPKAIQLTHLNCIVNSSPDNFFDESIKTIFMFGKWYHNYDNFFFHKFMSMGRTVVYLMDRSFHNILKCIEDYQVNIALVVPFILNLIVKEENLDKFNLDSLKFLYSRGSLLHKKTVENVKQRLPKLQNVLQGYGMSECGEPASDIWATEGPRLGSVGMAAPGIIFKHTIHKAREVIFFFNLAVKDKGVLRRLYAAAPCDSFNVVGPPSGDPANTALPGAGSPLHNNKIKELLLKKIVDLETNKNLGPNQLGEIRLTGPMFMKGYIDKDPSSYLDEEGFYNTGDVGYYDEDKYLYIVDRLHDVIIYKSNKISPLELEIILEMHEKVLEAAVVGKPDPVYGELPTAFVVKKPGFNVTEQELVDYVAAEVPLHMHLQGGVKFINELPRSDRGKILRGQLRKMLPELA